MKQWGNAGEKTEPQAIKTPHNIYFPQQRASRWGVDGPQLKSLERPSAQGEISNKDSM